MRTFTLRQLLSFVLASAAYLAVFPSCRDGTWRNGLGWGWADTVVVLSWILLSIAYLRWRLRAALITHVLAFWLPFLWIALLMICHDEDWGTPIELTISAEYVGCCLAIFVSFPIACSAICLRGLLRRSEQEPRAR